MKNPLIVGAAAVCLLAGSLSLSAQDRGLWYAASTNSKAITGDISIGASKVMFNYTGFTIAPIRTLSSAEVAAAFDADVNAGGNGQLYRLMIPADKRFPHHNTLCGTEDTQWMATYVSGRTLQVAFFSGSDQPVLTVDALNNGMNVCGHFTYGR